MKMNSEKLIAKSKIFSIVFLQVVVVLLGIGTLALMLLEPHLEDRNLNATVFEIYFKDPFLIYAYCASIAYFTALYQAFKLLGCIRKNNVFSQDSVKYLKTIKHCAIVIIAFIVGAIAYFIVFEASKGEDIAGGIMLGFIIIFISVIVATATTLFEKIMQNAVDIKSENDLTV